MKTKIQNYLLPLVLGTFSANIFSSCCSIAPVTTSLESGRMVKKGAIEGAVMYSSYSAKIPDQNGSFDISGNYRSPTYSMQTLNNNYGARILVGGEKTNWGFHYEKIVCAQCDMEVNYFSIEPKFRMVENVSAFSIPVGIYVPQGDNNSGTIVQFMPSFHFTYGGSKYFQFNFSPKLLFIANTLPSLPLINVTTGIGLSSDLKQWAIRPEIGYSISPYGGTGILQTSVGLSFTLGN